MMSEHDHELYTNAAGQFVFVGQLIDKIANLESILTKQEKRFDEAIDRVIGLEHKAVSSKQLIELLVDLNKSLRDDIVSLTKEIDGLIEAAHLLEAAEKLRQAKP